MNAFSEMIDLMNENARLRAELENMKTARTRVAQEEDAEKARLTGIIFDQSKKLKKAKPAIEALRAWFGFQSMNNTTTLYNAASKLFDSTFDPTEYDDVE